MLLLFLSMKLSYIVPGVSLLPTKYQTYLPFLDIQNHKQKAANKTASVQKDGNDSMLL
jgi:hypothetical protein